MSRNINFQTIKNIYDRMQDNASKHIFLSRLSYSLSGDIREVDKLVKHEMDRYQSEDVMNRLLSWINDNRCSKIALFGAGWAGRQIMHILSLNEINVDVVLDNNSALWGKEFYGVKIANPQCIAEFDAAVILGVNKYKNEIYEQVKNILGSDECIFDPKCEWWIGKWNQYFDEDILQPKNNEIFVDAGSFDGNDSRNFIKWTKGKYECIYSFEPDANNYKGMIKNCTDIADMIIEPLGLLDTEKQLKFIAGKTENSMFSEEGNVLIDVVSLDDYLCGRPITFLKMDIEGSEYRALEGARRTIEQYKPTLAICVYHKPEDIVEIPLKILEMDSNYVFYLRHYSYLHTETVLYAINKG